MSKIYDFENKIINTDPDDAYMLLNIVENKINVRTELNFENFIIRNRYGKNFEHYTALKFISKGYKVQFADRNNIDYDLIVNNQYIEVKWQMMFNNTLKFKYSNYSEKNNKYMIKGFANGDPNTLWFHYFTDQEDNKYLLRLTKKELREIYKQFPQLLQTYDKYQYLNIPLQYFKDYYPDRLQQLDL